MIIKETKDHVQLDCGENKPIDWNARIIWGVFIAQFFVLLLGVCEQ